MANDLDNQLDNLRKVDAANRKAIRTGTRRVVRPSKNEPPQTLKDDGKVDVPGIKYTGLPPRSQGNRDTGFDQWIADLDNVMTFVGVQGYNAQIRAAEAIASFFRKRLASGEYDNPELSPFSLAMGTENAKPGTKRKALATLAHHVVVYKPRQIRVGHKKAKPGQPGRAGVFGRGFHPAYVGFEESWDFKAFQLDQGYFIKISSSVAQKLMARAKALSGWEFIGDGRTSPVDGGLKIWYIPGRNFSKDLFGHEAKAILKTVLDGTYGDAGDVEKMQDDWEKILADEGMASENASGSVSWDTVEGVYGSETGMSMEEMIDMARDDSMNRDWDY